MRNSWKNSLPILAAIAVGPSFLALGDQMNLVFGPAAVMYALVSAILVPLIVAFGGRFKFLVWQLAALSLAISVTLDDLRVEANPTTHLSEYALVALCCWAGATILSSPLPVFLLIQKWRAKKQNRAMAANG